MKTQDLFEHITDKLTLSIKDNDFTGQTAVHVMPGIFDEIFPGCQEYQRRGLLFDSIKVYVDDEGIIWFSLYTNFDPDKLPVCPAAYRWL